MARIDSILSIVVKQGANELRVGADREPKMLAGGVPRRLSIPKTSESTLRELLGDILSPARDESLRADGRVELVYEALSNGSFASAPHHHRRRCGAAWTATLSAN